MSVKRWSRTDQVFLEGWLYAVPVLVLLAVVVQVVRAVRGEALEVTGPLPAALVRPAEGVSGPLTGTVQVTDPTIGDYGYALLPLLLALVLAVVAARLLLGIVRGLRDGDPFTAANARRLTSLAVLVFVGGLLLSVLHGVSQNALLSAALPAGLERPSVLDLPFWPAPVGTLVFFLAEVFSRGARLREDVDGLV